MPNTTNNNWPTPADTDLVKNGADAIRDLGNAIDTTLGVYSPVTPGLVKLSTVTFSAVASQSISSVFSSTYDNYLVLFICDNATTSAQDLKFRMRTGSDDSGANYYLSGFNNNSNNSAYDGVANTAQTSWNIAGVTASPGDRHFSKIEIINPNVASDTLMTSCSVRSDGTASVQSIRNGALNTATQYTGFTFFVSTTITGNVSVYGYNK